ncbi:MAG: hypothetical protein IPK03_13185 [Bacteroidetes bacterium]|nr:hypothetical protein [Bacteroidota bacterium]
MNKASKIFSIVSGVYLFLLTILLLTQPRYGYNATLKQVLFCFAFYLPLLALTAGVFFFATKNSDKNWYEFAFGRKTIFWTIILSVAIGFVSNLDYQKQFGCFVQEEAMFSTTKFIVSICSIMLLTIGYYISDTKLGTSLLILEFVLWALKTLYFNRSLDPLLQDIFTMICWILRLILIIKTLNKQKVRYSH